MDTEISTLPGGRFRPKPPMRLKKKPLLRKKKKPAIPPVGAK